MLCRDRSEFAVTRNDCLVPLLESVLPIWSSERHREILEIKPEPALIEVNGSCFNGREKDI
jgi:hypothetical protein